ncbi:MAG: ATP-binding protein [Bacilli bacterium]|nr:ATP-binding protein [Bacilli bacterium]
MYIKRNIEKTVLELSKQYPVIMVCGQRQVGKSTMLNAIKNNMKYVTFDDFVARNLAKTDPGLFFDTYGYPILIDEFQKEPSILEEIKRIVDMKNLKGEETNGLFWLTGSQKFRMMKNVSESLAGRVAVLDMSSLSMSEVQGFDKGAFSPDLVSLKKRQFSKMDVNEIFELIFQGGMPKIVTKDIDRERYYMDYVNTFLERDIKDLSQVGKLNAFYQFLVYIAAHTAQQLNYLSIANEIGVSSPTIKEWIAILERSGVIYLLYPYYTKVTDRLVKTPKIYFMDTGLAAYLTKWTSPETLANGAASGAFFETFVVTEIIKSYYNAGKPLNLFYYRDVDQREIDLLFVDSEKIYPVEIKKNKNPTINESCLKVLEKYNMKIEPMLVLCMSETLLPLSRNIYLCPISII